MDSVALRVAITDGLRTPEIKLRLDLPHSSWNLEEEVPSM